FTLAGTVTIAKSGVVLRGSGSGAQGTLVNVTGTPRTPIAIAGTGTWQTTGTAAKVTDSYVPSGATSFTVDDASGLAGGATILIGRPGTASWVHFMGMDTLVRNGVQQTWLSTTTVIKADRVVTAIAGNRVTIDAPITDSYDATYVSPPGVTVERYAFPG